MDTNRNRDGKIDNDLLVGRNTPRQMKHCKNTMDQGRVWEGRYFVLTLKGLFKLEDIILEIAHAIIDQRMRVDRLRQHIHDSFLVFIHIKQTDRCDHR